MAWSLPEINKNKTNINCLAGARKWKSMVIQIFGLFINLLFVFLLCPFGIFVVAAAFNMKTFAIYGFDIHIWKFQSSKKCVHFPKLDINNHWREPRERTKMVFSFLFAFYYISTFKCLQYFPFWVKRVVVSIYLFCAFNHIFERDCESCDNVHIQIFWVNTNTRNMEFIAMNNRIKWKL